MRTLFVLAFAACGLAAPVHAQTLADEVRLLRDEVAALRAEIASLRAERSATSAAAQEPVGLPVETQVELIRSQLAEHAQTKVESASRLPLKLSGSLVSSTFFNSGTPNWLDLPNIARAGAAGRDQGSFSSTLRQSRVGLEAAGLTLGAWAGAGSLVFDFFGGIPGFQTGQVMGLPRLLYAFVRLDHARGSVLVGQDDAIVAPRSPTSLSAVSFPALFRSGNLYLRVPQIRGEVRVRTGTRSTVRLLGGVVAPVAGDFLTEQYAFVPPELAGERSERPALQARSVFEYAIDETHALAIAVAGHQSRAELAGGRSSWIAATDFNVQWGAFGAAGEAFAADRAGAYGAALGQQARTRGGWAELRVTPTYRWRFVVGAGADRLRRREESFALRGNRAGFAGIRYSLTPELHIGVEYSRLGTTPGAARTITNHHIDGVLRYDF